MTPRDEDELTRSTSDSPPAKERNRGSEREELLIRWHGAGTHADIRYARLERPPQGEGYLLQPDGSYFGIPYEFWAEWVGRTADVLHLQAVAERARASKPAMPVAPQLSENGWHVEVGEDTEIRREAAETSEYGFTTGCRMVACSREQLIAQCLGAPETPRVWTPSAPLLVRPEKVPFLVEALRETRRRSAAKGVLIASSVLVVILILAADAGARSGWTVMLALSAAWFTMTLLEYRRAQTGGAEAFAAAREEFRHDVWVGSHRALHTELILALLVVIFLAQSMDVTESVATAGLVKGEVRNGEVWRLLTGALLHGGVLHLGMNGIALWSLGPLVEAHSPRAFLSLLFLISALCGSTASLLLIPDTTSVGASGGILGIAGYLLVMGYRRRQGLPRGYVQRLGAGVLATAVLGLVGYEWVDNATHFSGFLAGMLLAMALADAPRDHANRGVRTWETAGLTALALLFGAALGIVLLISAF